MSDTHSADEHPVTLNSEVDHGIGAPLGKAAPLNAPLGPLDGRYRATIAPLAEHLSEAGLNRQRLHVEAEWLIHLCQQRAIPTLRELTPTEEALLRSIAVEFDEAAVAQLAGIEQETRHDVKAVEYYLKNQLADTSLADISEFVHVFCTSEDINNVAYALMIRDAITMVWLPMATSLVHQLTELAHAQAEQPMLARTHGQPATPTTLGKELAVFAYRLQRQVSRIHHTDYVAKINGATGTFSAHAICCPATQWLHVSREFIENMKLTWNPLTTQIESHDWQAELYADIARFNRIAHNLCTDIWSYISLGYFTQARDQGSVGSSTMPHKVNPIRFENAEANLEVSCALLDVLATTLVTSRLQRDLTDSSMQRNIAPAFGHSVLALDNIRRGLSGLEANPAVMTADLNTTWEVLGEAVQSMMRIHGMDNPYERLKELTRGKQINAQAMRDFIAQLGLPGDATTRLLALTPRSYIGLAPQLVGYLDSDVS